ncbi:DUF2254 domain-containing protein [Paracoccus lutimaris]|uniref:Putative membrane protein n=1 Tax=Paracoccus lutimaris TaxID=1490030 RepID=A0A368Z5C3_9RHOB|nr:DUF2254 domain-containing protein [Paracoccus lutimaris]RCW87179.1 putative membrane protein [Paracoccus lutimaris]
MSKIRWILSRLGRQLWVHVVLYAVLGVVAAMAASLATRYLPWPVPIDVSTDAIDSLLTVISSSMLAVTTFSVGALTSAYGAATSNGTPRATTLLAEDQVVQSALATFVGSFLFSIVGLVALRVSAYGPQGRALLFLTTLAVIVLIVLALLRWIDQLTRLGRVADTTARLEEATHEAMQARLDLPCLGGQRLQGSPDADRGGVPIPAGRVGYVEHVDTVSLSAICENRGWRLDVLVLPGSFVYADTPLARVHTGAGQGDAPDETLRALIHAAFTLGATRTFDQDPRFGLVALSEVALRALSPAVNDPGTAIDVIGRQTRLLTHWAQEHAKADAPGRTAPYPRLSVPPLDYGDLYEDAFNLIGRDGAGQIDVMLRLVKALRALTRIGPPEARQAAERQLAIARDRAMQNLPMAEERDRLAAALA